MPEEELRRAKDYLKGSLMLGLESTSAQGQPGPAELFFRASLRATNGGSMEAVTAGRSGRSPGSSAPLVAATVPATGTASNWSVKT